MTGGEGLVNLAVATTTGGVGLGLGFFFVRWLAVFLAGRWDRREAQIDAGTKLLIDQLTAQVTALGDRLRSVEDDLAECKKRHAESEAEQMRLKAMLQGYGDARQNAALEQAAIKLAGKGGKP